MNVSVAHKRRAMRTSCWAIELTGRENDWEGENAPRGEELGGGERGAHGA